MDGTTGVAGLTAGGNTPAWIIQVADIQEPAPTEAKKEIKADAFTQANSRKIDCHVNMDGISLDRQMRTREQQRMCQKIATTIKTGETINVDITGIYDQQKAGTEEINHLYTSLPEGATVYLVQAFGWDAAKDPAADMVCDVIKMRVNQRTKNQPVEGEDLMFTANASGLEYLQDVKVVA
ncbi:phage tail tube protein [Dermabacteraceae bacterium P7006]